MGRLEAARDEVSGWKWVIRWKPEENRKEVCEGGNGHAFCKNSEVLLGSGISSFGG